jgi:uncharacterized membrane protein HdeD (DUF308 family)
MRLFILPSPQNAFIRGILTAGVGVLFLSIPDLTLKSVIMTVGGMIVLSGIFTLLFSRKKRNNAMSLGSSFQGFFNIVWGLLFLLFPMVIVKVFGIFFGIILLLLGLMQLMGALGTLSRSVLSWIYLIFALLMVSGGAFLLVKPIESAENIITFLGAILLVYGLFELMMAWRLKKMPKGANAGNIVDTTYEELK